MSRERPPFTRNAELMPGAMLIGLLAHWAHWSMPPRATYCVPRRQHLGNVRLSSQRANSHRPPVPFPSFFSAAGKTTQPRRPKRFPIPLFFLYPHTDNLLYSPSHLLINTIHHDAGLQDSAPGFLRLGAQRELTCLIIQPQAKGRPLIPTLVQLSKVAVLGASGGIGQPLSLLMKLNPRVTELALYDIRGGPGKTSLPWLSLPGGAQLNEC